MRPRRVDGRPSKNSPTTSRSCGRLQVGKSPSGATGGEEISPSPLRGVNQGRAPLGCCPALEGARRGESGPTSDLLTNFPLPESACPMDHPCRRAQLALVVARPARRARTRSPHLVTGCHDPDEPPRPMRVLPSDPGALPEASVTRARSRWAGRLPSRRRAPSRHPGGGGPGRVLGRHPRRGERGTTATLLGAISTAPSFPASASVRRT